MEKKNNLEYVKCNNCGSDDYRVLFKNTIMEKDDSFAKSVWQYTGTTNDYGKYFRIVKCRNCGLIYENPRDNKEYVLQNYHEVVDNDYLATQEERRSTFNIFLVEIEKFSSPGKLLDIGCYAGLFLDVARSKGWEVVGIEPSRWARECAKSKGINVVSDTLDEAVFPDKFFDVITMWDVIEHLTNPKFTLSEINRITKVGGLLAITTHDPESIVARLLGAKYPFIMRMHLYHFSPRLMKEMLAKAGYDVLRIRSNGRRFRISYLIDRLGIDPKVKKFIQTIAGYLHIDNIKLNIDFKDTYCLYARKIKDV